MARKKMEPAANPAGAKTTASGATSGAARSRRRGKGGRGRRFWLVLLIGAVLLIGVSFYLAFGTQTGTASIAAQDFCAALVAHDYAHAYDQLSDRLRGEGTAAQFAASQQALDEQKGPARDCAFSDPRVSANTASFTLTLARAGSGGAASGSLQLIYELGHWRVDGYDANVI